MTETIARLHIALTDTDPSIWRRAEVPLDASLKMLHDVIQAAMGWLDYHLWEFEAGDWTCNGLVPVTCLSLCHFGFKPKDLFRPDMSGAFGYCKTR